MQAQQYGVSVSSTLSSISQNIPKFGVLRHNELAPTYVSLAKLTVVSPLPFFALQPWLLSHKSPLIRSRAESYTHELSGRIRALPHWDILDFSDSSKQKDGFAGAGAVILHKGVTVAEVRVLLGPDCEVYDSEIIGALAGLKAAIAAPTSHLATSIYIILDNQETSQRLLDISPSKSS